MQKTLKSIWGWLGICIYGCVHLILFCPALFWLRIVAHIFEVLEKRRRDWLFGWFRVGSGLYLWLLRIFVRAKIRYEGFDEIKTGSPVILVSNHRSFFDHLINAEVLRRLGAPRALWAMKASVSKIPGLGRWTQELGCAALRRRGEDTSGDLQRLALMAKTAKNYGEGVAIYPQGRRAARGECLAPKAGGFMTLAQALPQYPIVFVHLDYQGVSGGKKVTGMAAFIGARITVTVQRVEREEDEDLQEMLFHQFASAEVHARVNKTKAER